MARPLEVHRPSQAPFLGDGKADHPQVPRTPTVPTGTEVLLSRVEALLLEVGLVT